MAEARTVLDIELRLIKDLGPVYRQEFDKETRTWVETDEVFCRNYVVVYQQRKKGKDLIRVGIVRDPFLVRGGPTVRTTYDPITGKWWGHDPEIEDLIKSGAWKELPVLDTSKFERE